LVNGGFEKIFKNFIIQISSCPIIGQYCGFEKNFWKFYNATVELTYH